MSIEIKVPVLPESVAEATVLKWHKKAGEQVKRDESLVDIETDKVVLEVPASSDGLLEEIVCPEGTNVTANQVIGLIKAGSVAETVSQVNGTITKKAENKETEAKSKPQTESASANLSPSVRRMASALDVDVAAIKGSGKGGRVVKEDIEKHLAGTGAGSQSNNERPEKRVPMSRLRQRIAERLLSAQQNMAILTTFNEINMQAVMDLRKQHKDEFEKRYNSRLGFMSFFVKAVVSALKRFPDVNAFIDGSDIVYHGFYDIGVAVSTERGLVVPILRDADILTMAEIEGQVADFAQKARNNKLTVEEMTGGTFTITNGGVFGSLLATPILNPPQSAILGMHKIEERPIAENGQVVIRPMMYVALSYDHRIIDGRDSVQFLKTVKELIEDPARLLLDI